MFIRKFTRIDGKILVNHLYCIIPLLYRGKGLIKSVFKSSLQQYVNMNADKIIVHAGLDSGGYVWAKFGFVAVNNDEVSTILANAEKRLTKVQYEIINSIYIKYYARDPNGRSFPMTLWANLDFMKDLLMGSDWKGELDLKNSEQFSNFKEYVFR
jgi:hypothetical protein